VSDGQGPPRKKIKVIGKLGKYTEENRETNRKKHSKQMLQLIGYIKQVAQNK